MEHFIDVKKSARYFSSGTPTSKKIVIVLHGYGQLAEYFIRKFSSLNKDWYVVAPEGLHRFYLNGHSGRVGASWMTKEAREKDIEDNINWLDELLRQLLSENHYEKIVLLGFSQGAATAARYFYHTTFPIDQLIVWASVFPSDIDSNQLFEKQNRIEKTVKNTFVIGTKDIFFNAEQRKGTVAFFEKLGFETIEFEGNHDIDVKTLSYILQKL